MADFDLSMRITGDGAEAVAAVNQVDAATQKLNATEGAAAAQGDKLASSSINVTKRLRDQSQAINEVVRASNPAVGSQQALQAAVSRAEAAYIRGKISAEAYARAQDLAKRATVGAATSMGQARVGSMMLGQQIQDVGMQIALGTSPLRVFAMQAGQTALAVQQMGGSGSAFAKFIGGPWGSLILAGVSILALFTASVQDHTKALELAETGADALGKAQSVLSGMFNMTSGAIEHQNALLIANARLTAINLRAEAQQKRESANQTFGNVMNGGGGATGAVRSFLAWSRGGSGTAEARQNLFGSNIQAILSAKTPEARAKAIDQALRATELRGNTADTDVIKNLSGVSGKDWRQALIDTATAAQNESVAGLIDQSLNSGKLSPGLRRDAKAKKGPKPKKGPDPAVLENFGLDTADRLANLGAQFQDMPTQVDRVQRATAELDKTLRDVERRKPPNMQALLTQGEQVRRVIIDGLQKPYRDFIADQQEGLGVQRLVSQGRDDEAEALKIELGLEKQIGPLLPEQKDAILAIVQARKAEERQLEILREKQQKYLDALGGVKDAVRGIFDISGQGLRDLPKKLAASFEKLVGDYLFDRFFGKAFRELEDQVKGTHIVEDASTRMGDAIARANNAIGTLGDAAIAASARLAGGAAAGAGTRMGSLADTVAGLSDPGAAPSSGGAAGEGDDGAIVVHGQRIMSRGVPTDPAGFMGYVVNRLLAGLNIFGDKASEKISKAVGSAMEGAAIGSAASNLLLGGKSNNTGAAIGGALGNIAGKALGSTIASAVGGGLGKALGGAAGPIGSILGGLAGSMIGNLLFKPTPKTGGVVLTSATDAASAHGNDSATKTAASGSATSIQSALSRIADQLGGQLGSFKLSIGAQDGKWSVDPLGLNRSAKPGMGGVAFGTDEAAAVAFALSDAIADGGIKGLSAAVQKALKKYGSDIDRSLQEAIKVQQIETLLKGVGGVFDKTFRDLETQLAERVRIAKEYGFDLVKLEEINAKERADTFNQVMKDRIGSLQDLLDNLSFGDLFEGTPMDQRTALLGKIADAKTAADRGDTGAADNLATLERQLITLSRDTFGTAGPEYGSDRAGAISNAQAVIAAETERARKAQEDATAALNAQVDQVALMNEANDIAAASLGKLTNIADALGGSGGFNPAPEPMPSTFRTIGLR